MTIHSSTHQPVGRPHRGVVIPSILFSCYSLAAANTASATSFTLSSDSTSAQTLGSGAGQAGTVSAGVSLTVSGATVAVTVSGNNATLTNLGTINQTGTGRVVRDNTGVTGLTVNNGSSTNSTALMQAADADVIQMNKSPASVTLNNYGTMTSLNASAGGAQAVDFNAILSGSNIVNNYATGVMQATEADAVRPGVGGVVNNDGLMTSTTTTGSSSDGVDAQTNSGVAVVNAFSAGAGTGTGMIEGGRHGITGGNIDIAVNNGAYAMSVTNNLGGTIQGDNGSGINIDGINGNELVTIVNHGTITGNGVTADGDGVDVDGLVNITNSGTIHSLNSLNNTSEGVTVGGGTIDNSGTIQGSINAPAGNTGTGRGITIAGVDKDPAGNPIPVQAPYGPANITNSGLIKGDSDAGIAFTSALVSGFSNTITNTATGTIEGGGAVAALQTGMDNDTVNNAGLIKADSSGKAIDLGGGDNTLNIQGGAASVIGDISGGVGGSNTLNFNIGAGNSFAYAGVLSNFANVNVNGGTTMLSGASIYAGPTTVNSGSLLATNTTGSATGSGAVEVKAGAVFGGSGAITGPLTLDLGATLSPGVAGVGTLVVGDTVMGAGSAFAVDLDPTNSQGHGIADLLNVAGSISLDHADLFISLLSAPTLGQTFDILANDGGDLIVGLFNQGHYASANYGGHSYQFYVDYAFNADGGAAGNDIRLTEVGVPEPGTGFLFGLGGLVLAFKRRFAKV